MTDPLSQPTVYGSTPTPIPSPAGPPPNQRGNQRAMLGALVAVGVVLIVTVGVLVGLLITKQDKDERSLNSASEVTLPPVTLAPTTAPVEPVTTASTSPPTTARVTVAAARRPDPEPTQRISTERAADRFDEYLSAASGFSSSAFVNQFSYPLPVYYRELDADAALVRSKFEEQVATNESVYFGRSSAVQVKHDGASQTAEISASFEYLWIRTDGSEKSGTTKLFLTVALDEGDRLPIVGVHE